MVVTPSAMQRRSAARRPGDTGARRSQLASPLPSNGCRRRLGRSPRSWRLKPQLELARPRARVDEVGMAVDEARRDERTVKIVLGFRSRRRRQIANAAQPADRAVARSRSRIRPADPSRCLRPGVTILAFLHSVPVMAHIPRRELQPPADARPSSRSAPNRSTGGGTSNQASVCASMRCGRSFAAACRRPAANRPQPSRCRRPGTMRRSPAASRQRRRAASG